VHSLPTECAAFAQNLSCFHMQKKLGVDKKKYLAHEQRASRNSTHAVC